MERGHNSQQHNYQMGVLSEREIHFLNESNCPQEQHADKKAREDYRHRV